MQKTLTAMDRRSKGMEEEQSNDSDDPGDSIVNYIPCATVSEVQELNRKLLEDAQLMNNGVSLSL